MLVPVTVLRYFTPVERIDPLYVQVRSPQHVDGVAARVQGIVAGRHRPGANYRVETMTAILNAAKNISLILSLVLILVSTITLVISGIGIMNIMLVTVTERTREIGVRLAVGASAREILTQFLTEAMMVSLSGGCAGHPGRGGHPVERPACSPISAFPFRPSPSWSHLPFPAWSAWSSESSLPTAPPT